VPYDRLDTDKHGRFQVVLGRHFFEAGVLAYDGRANTVTWTFTVSG
jgi:hypothetical protein